MFTIRKSFAFSAAHHLLGLPATHQCARFHGHNYVVVVELANNKLNDIGFVQDYGEMKPIKEYIDKTLDHRDLNEIIPVSNPTAENMAFYFFHYFRDHLGFKNIKAVEVSETPLTNCRFEL